MRFHYYGTDANRKGLVVYEWLLFWLVGEVKPMTNRVLKQRDNLLLCRRAPAASLLRILGISQLPGGSRRFVRIAITSPATRLASEPKDLIITRLTGYDRSFFCALSQNGNPVRARHR